MKLSELCAYLDETLQAKDFSDVSYNGVQVATEAGLNAEVKKIATACSASLEAIDAAVEAGADTLLVHHGLFWRGANPCLTGNLYQRVKTLMEHNLNLVAYHLPMDAHLTYGNNAVLTHLLGGEVVDYIEPGHKQSIGVRARLAEPLTVKEIVAILCHHLDTKVSLLGPITEDMLIDDLAVCSGSGSSLLDKNNWPTFQALITGDVNEQTYHQAIETGTVVFVVGHHASEQLAINLLGDHLSEKFGLEHSALHFSYEKMIPTFAIEDDDADDEDEDE